MSEPDFDGPDFGGKVVLVTGAGSGIGRATALAFARAGARVVASDISAGGGAETLDQIRSAGGEAIFVAADVARAADMEALVGRTVATYGRLDCAFNNAGIDGGNEAMLDWDEAVFDRTMSVNVKGVFLSMKYEIPVMLGQGAGAIVNAASVVGLVGALGPIAYVTSKHAVVGLTRTAALQYATRGIRVNAVCPGVIRTPMVARALAADPAAGEIIGQMHPMMRLGEPPEVADAVLWLCSDQASFVTGHPLAVDGGCVAR
jgi:NAD(P)-dependent dehydrogenase (short-subunit alcohol dehydrogenase family)